MTHFASVFRGEKALKDSKNYHRSHHESSKRMYLCGCMPEISTKNYIVAIRGKRLKSSRKTKYFHTLSTLWNFIH